MDFDPKQAVPWDPWAIDWNEIEAIRRQPGSERVAQSLRLRAMAMEIELSGIRAQHPGLSESEARERLAQRVERFWSERDPG